ncbi:hypothetical protein [Natronorubrum aibiense]|uniref:hypothetical protein n=1 Tax=Natronorubrum aibiense TaxID=348826 RepID=UPI00128F8F75|nr:hypothetical protein [Natronorubrum aibiense]
MSDHIEKQHYGTADHLQIATYLHNVVGDWDDEIQVNVFELEFSPAKPEIYSNS